MSKLAYLDLRITELTIELQARSNFSLNIDMQVECRVLEKVINGLRAESRKELTSNTALSIDGSVIEYKLEDDK